MAWNPGLQVERTSYAWIRTCLSMALASGAVMKLAAFEKSAPSEVSAAVAMALWLGMTVIAWRRGHSRSRDLIRGRAYRPLVSPVLAAASAVLLCGAVVLLIDV